MKYRSKMEIIDAILRTANPSATKTRIMYSAYLSYSQLKVYLSLLEVCQLISLEADTGSFKITEKGLQFMSTYDEIRELVSGIQQ